MQDRGARPAVARVMGAADDPVGAAFLVTPTLLLTAAHVVSLAAGNRADGAERPTGEVLLSFAVAPDRLLRAELVHWVPPGDASPEDIAGLRLIDPPPEGVTPSPLTDLVAPLGRRVVTLGFPRDAPNGGWGLGRLAGADARALVQIDTLPDSQFTIEEGFSGTPVWDIEDRAVAGMVVEGWTRGRRSGFMIPTSLLLAAWPALAGEVWPASPFRGLRSFSERDSATFFGRDELIRRIVGLSENAPVLTVVGPSGIGKSSLLNAGVLPKLRRREGLVVATMRPSQAQTPLRAVALALARVARPDADPPTRGTWVDDFADRLARGLVAEVVGDVLDGRGGERLLLVVDQLEEILLATPDELTQVAAVLRHCLGPRSRLDLLAALRVDFLGQALRHRGLADLVQDTRLVTVGELSESELRAAIVEPVRRTRMVRYEAGLVDRLLTDVGLAPGRLPLLQFTLAMLWDEQDGGVLTHHAYDALGGIDSALAGHAEAIWSGLGAQERTAAGRLLVQLLYPLSESIGFVGRTALRTQLDAAQWDAGRRLAADRARLVVVREQDGAEVVELAHDALVTNWRRLKELGEQDREFREWQEGLRQRIRRDAPPLTGADLRDALRWQAGRGADLAPAERAYLHASRRRRTLRRRRWALGVGAVAAVAGLLVNQQQHRVASNAANAMIHDMQSRDITRTDPYAVLRVTLRAYRTSANLVTRQRVALAYGHYARTDRIIPDYTARPIPLPGGRTGHTEPPSSMAQKVSADGRSLVTTDPQGNVTLWRINGGRATGRALGQVADRVTISRDGRYVAYLQGDANLGTIGAKGPKNSCGGDNCLYLYDTATGRTRRLGTLGGDLGFRVIRFDPTGRVLAAAYPFGAFKQRLVTWDVAGGRRRDEVTVPGGEIDATDDMWVAPGGHRVWLDAEEASFPGSRVFNDTLISVDLAGASPVSTRMAGEVASDQFAVSGDGRRIGVMVSLTPPLDRHPRKKVVVLDVATGRKLAQVPALSEKQSLGKIALDLHGDRVFLTADLADTVSVWRVGDTAARPVTLHEHGWQDVLPLGDGDDTPLLLVDNDVVGLVLPAPGRPAPMRRLAAPLPYVAGETPSRDEHPDRWYGEMSAMLVSGVPAPDETPDLPSGAYTGRLGG